MKGSIGETSTLQGTAPTGKIADRRRGVRRETREITLIIAAIVVLLAVGAINHRFMSIENIRFMVLNSVVLSLLALGQTWVIATKGIDLSVAPINGPLPPS